MAGARRAVSVEGELPDLRDAVVVAVDTEANIAVGDVPWGLAPDRRGPRPDRTLSSASPPAGRSWSRCATPTGIRMSGRSSTTWRLAGRVAVVVEWGWPGPYDGRLPRICTRGDSRPARAAVTELLMGTGWNR